MLHYYAVLIFSPTPNVEAGHKFDRNMIGEHANTPLHHPVVSKAN